ncbi:hypothetical protein Bpla01_66350 [Burkholderia plantarii]|nr:hypothetical protein Bpla01_66350 [Burkholderia plantarii]
MRALQGFAQSLRDLAFADLPIPNYTTVCRCAQTLLVKLPVVRSRESLHLVIDSTGVKVYGEGESKVRQHGYAGQCVGKQGVDTIVKGLSREILARVSTGQQHPHQVEGPLTTDRLRQSALAASPGPGVEPAPGGGGKLIGRSPGVAMSPQ